MAWQPIETAPKDGTEVLLSGPSLVVYAGEFGPQDQDDPGQIVQRQVMSGHYSQQRQCWLDSRGADYGHNVFGWGVLRPTRWQPLPKPSSDSDAVGQSDGPVRG